jgi:hypothetical protein
MIDRVASKSDGARKQPEAPLKTETEPTVDVSGGEEPGMPHELPDDSIDASSLQGRIDLLQDATIRGSELEQAMLHEPVHLVSPNGTANAGVSTTYVVVFESGRKAILKTFEGQHPNACVHYGQDRFEAPTHEVVAWRLAHALGGRWEQMVPTAVLRDVPDAGAGVLINWRDGDPDMAVFNDAKEQVFAAAFWDALIGQQDRHARNFRYDRSSRRLALIDNAFAFARQGDLFASSMFLAHRRQQHATTLSEPEHRALGELLEHDDLFGLRLFLGEDRVEAVENRARAMHEKRLLPLPGAY